MHTYCDSSFFKASFRTHALDKAWLFLGHVLVTALPETCAPGAPGLNPLCFSAR